MQRAGLGALRCWEPTDAAEAMGEVPSMGGRRRRALRRLCLGASAICVVLSIALPALAQDEASGGPAVWSGNAVTVGASFAVDRDGLLPVPNALRFTALDGLSQYDTDLQTARASVLYPGEGVLQGPNLLCGTFGGMFPPEAKPILDLCATYDYPLSVSADASNPDRQTAGSTRLGKLTDPISADGFYARAHADVEETSSDAVIEDLRVIGFPVFDLLRLLPLQDLQLDSSVANVESAKGTTRQRIDDEGRLVVEATATLSGIKLVGGLIRIGSIVSTSRVTDDGAGKRTSDASVDATGVTVAGVPARITEDGLLLGSPSGASGPLQQQLIDALRPLLDGLGVKLSVLETVEDTDERGQAVASAAGILLEVNLSASGLPTLPGPLGDIDPNGTYVGNVQLGRTEASGTASIFDPDAVPVDEGIDLGTTGGDFSTDLGVDLPPSSPVLPTDDTSPPGRQAPARSSTDLFGGRLELLYAAFALAVLGLCIAPRLTVPARFPGPPA
jgi:hypothetical protein